VQGSTDEHERILELLAGSVLLALEGEDLEEAERLLAEHVPGCPACRSALAELQATAAELALAAPPIEPPELLLPGLRRRISDAEAGRRRGLTLAALVAGVTVLVGMAGLSISLGSRATRAEAERITAVEMLSAMRDPSTRPVPLQATSSTAVGGLVELAHEERLYLYGEDVPDPIPGHAYQLWLGSGGVFTPVGEPFVPHDGIVLLRLTVDPGRFDEILITEEPLGEVPERPTLERGRSWHADIAA
jgi:hypothetical protein